MSTNDNDHLPQNQHESNRNLVNYLWKNGFIKSPLVRDAFLAVDRKWYAPVDPYSNVPQILGDQSTISAPSMHARAVELLLPFLLPMSSTHNQELGLISVSGISGRPRRILDIGSGSGFLVHIFSKIAGKTGKVLGVEHVEPLRSLGESNMLMSPGGAALLASGRTSFRLGDGRYGWKEPNSDDKPASDDDGCWDVIHVGAAAVELPPELVRQLRKPGRMFIPIAEREGDWLSDKYLWIIEKGLMGTSRKRGWKKFSLCLSWTHQDK